MAAVSKERADSRKLVFLKTGLQTDASLEDLIFSRTASVFPINTAPHGAHRFLIGTAPFFAAGRFGSSRRARTCGLKTPSNRGHQGYAHGSLRFQGG